MALNNIVQSGVNTALSILDSFRIDIVYTQKDALVYDVDSDDYTGDVTTLNLRVVETRITDEEKTGLYPIVPKAGYDTRKLIVNAADLPAGFIPDVQDSVTYVGAQYEVVKVVTVPAKSIYIIFIGRAT
jgi:hypothetical protein